jgi:proton-dependent oligopeptide transporter, POT family
VAQAAPLPSQIPYIVGNEAAERFSFYGMRNLLTTFLPASILLLYLPAGERKAMGSEIYHTFLMGVYFFPLLGGWLSDRFFGKYHTIFWFSLIYLVGQGFVAFSSESSLTGFYVGLFLIAFGSGGIKPLISSFVGDQFDETNKDRSKVVFDAFYWSINLGSFFASLLMPIFLRNFGPMVAFLVPAALMLVAVIVFVAGRRHYVVLPPVSRDPHSFARVCASALREPGPGQIAFVLGCALAALLIFGAPTVLLEAPVFFMHYLKPAHAICLGLFVFIAVGGVVVSQRLELARKHHPAEAVEGVRGVLRVVVAFGLITPFWTLFDQKASTWVYQGEEMILPTWFEPAQMQLVNPALVMMLIPFNNLVLFPWLRRRGWKLTSLGKMTTGIFLAGVAYVITGGYQLVLDGGTPMWITWQVIPYLFLTMGEVLVSATGLEFAYSQAPLSMKGVIMSFWFLGTTLGNLWTLLAQKTVHEGIAATQVFGMSKVAFLMFLFAVVAIIAAWLFKLFARRYVTVDHYRSSSTK